MSSKAPKKKYGTVFNSSYTENFPCIRSSKKGNTFAYCSLCLVDFSIFHRGTGDIVKHVNTIKHQGIAKTVGGNKKIEFVQQKNDDSVIRAESFFTSFLIEHNIPINAADHAGPLFRKMFPDSDIAKRYGCARTKTTAIIGEMAKTERMAMVNMIKGTPFAISTDGSNKSDKKLYPIVVSYHDVAKQQNDTCLLSVPVLEGDGTGQNIAQLILNELKSYDIPLENCLSLGVDNAPVMVGMKAGVAGILKKEMPHLFVQGCLCHLINLAAEKSAACIPVKIEEYMIDIYYYLEKSAKRKENLKKFQELYGSEIRKILKHVSTRWLSLGRCLLRILDQWDPLTSFFKGEVRNGSNSRCPELQDFKIPKLKQDTSSSGSNTSAPKISNLKKRISSDSVLPAAKKQKASISIVNSACYSKEVLTREERLFMFLSSNLNKAFVYFLLNSLPLFEEPNISLQTNNPKIHVLRSLLLEMFKRVLSRFMRPASIKSSASVLDVDYHSDDNQKIDTELVIGQATSKIVDTLSEKEQTLFYSTVRAYYVKACDYMRLKFPYADDVIVHSEVANMDMIAKASFTSVKFFIERFPGLLKALGNIDKDMLLDDLQSQFCSLQVEEIPEFLITEERMDVKWSKLFDLYKDKYGLLSKFMLSILTIPHSNAECERIFSLVTKNLTQFRSTLSSQNLESLLTVKSNMTSPCFQQNFETEFLKRAKSATTVLHSNNV